MGGEREAPVCFDFGTVRPFIACTWLIILAGRGALKVNTNPLSTTAGSWGEMILATMC